jgi:hypothetical protein
VNIVLNCNLGTLNLDTIALLQKKWIFSSVYQQSVNTPSFILFTEKNSVNLKCIDEGVGRSTTGMVMTYLIKEWLEGFQKSLAKV